MSILALIAASALVMADPPAAATATATATATAKPAKPGAFADDDKMVCKTVEVTGSLFPKKDCRTKHEWAQLAQDSKDLTNDITTNHQTASPFAGK